MRVLAVDTASKSCSVAMIEGDTLLAEITLSIGDTHSKHVAGMIESVCRESGQALTDIDGCAVTIGPGSFTGLRIGVSRSR